jgi:ABC-type Na+ efflux pump permease subunit
MLAKTSRKTVGVWDIPRVFFAPRSLFARVEDVRAYAWPFVLLLTAVTLIGYATIETGLIDRQVDLELETQIEQIEKQQLDVVERSQLKKQMDDARKGGDFMRLMRRIQVIVAEPAKVMASCLLISALFYGLVALTGRKPEWHTLLTVCVFASFIDVVRLLFRLVLMLSYGRLEVDTSLGVLAALLPQNGEHAQQTAAMLGHVLGGIEPLAIWFWIVVCIGLTTTVQLRGWKAWTSCTLFWLVAVLTRMGMSFAAAAQPTGGGA